MQPFEAWYAVPRSSVARPSAQPTCTAASSACSLSTTPAHSSPSSCDAQGKWGCSCWGGAPAGARGMKGLATHLQCARSSFAIAQQLAQVRGLLRLQVRFARIKELLQEPEAQRVLRLSLCQSLGDRVIWRLACSALLNGLAPPHKPHATDLHRRRGRSDVGGLDVEGCAWRKRQHAHVSMRRHTLPPDEVQAHAGGQLERRCCARPLRVVTHRAGRTAPVSPRAQQICQGRASVCG